MALSQTKIAKSIQSKDDLDFEFLRKKGIEYIESLGSKLWTDYNTHDPGITILELLCYAITDLGLRISMPVEDLLHGSAGKQQFFEAHEILPNQALTALDYRKLLIDVDPVQIHNCFLLKHQPTLYINCRDGLVSLDSKIIQNLPHPLGKQTPIKGLYTLWLDLADEVQQQSQLVEAVLQRFHANRNLCEDIASVQFIKKEKIKVCASIELAPQADEHQIYAQIVLIIEAYFSPKVQFYSLKELLDTGMTSDKIFEGPLLEHGFIKDEELHQKQLRSEVRLSDLINLIQSIEGVQVIEDMSISYCTGTSEASDAWNLCIKPHHKPSLCEEKSVFTLTKEGLPLTVAKAKVAAYRERLTQQEQVNLLGKSKDKTLDFPSGSRNPIGVYRSISHNFPENYGIGEVGLSDQESPARLAQAKQLKGYLLFFDQILASYFKHLAMVKDQLSMNGTLHGSYFSQAIKDMKGVEELLKDFEDYSKKDLFNNLDDSDRRITQVKNHLIARFAENFGNYAFLMKNLYGDISDEIVYKNMHAFIRNYDSISRKRGSAFNYYKQTESMLWNTYNVSGLENRIAALLGIKLSDEKSYKRESISTKFVEIYLANATEYRWRIRDTHSQIVLTATENYTTVEAAEQEMYQSIFKAINSDRKAIQNIRNTNFRRRKSVHVIEIVKSEEGQFSFNIINPSIRSLQDPKRIIARQFRLFDTIEEVKAAIFDLIDFLMDQFTDEGIHVVEHLLLLPGKQHQSNPTFYFPICKEDCNSACSADPYSFRLSVVLPGYTQRFSDMNFRAFAEDLIRREIPAHILAKICWVGYRKNSIDDSKNDLLQFEENLRMFLIDKAAGRQTSIPAFIQSIQQLKNIYPSGHLHDCASEGTEGKIILGRTNL
ncbi:YegP family protein [Mongoliitalea daihaiensis]|uniref:hypothetical protein n=1 Tax=Mongoliitalea daihaiensis TaxID=2782006 RepID=UPI001F3840D3|nr:hypothetical protein [Mongoliitalea daihaiensis]UJP63804.1 hypothetical protein IPZ59_13315 [Mongoliitalea daihaiensis]